MLIESVSLTSLPPLGVRLPLRLRLVFFNFFLLLQLRGLLLVFGELSGFVITLDRGDRGESIVCNGDFDLEGDFDRGDFKQTEGDLGRERDFGFGNGLDFAVDLDLTDEDFFSSLLSLEDSLDFS